MHCKILSILSLVSSALAQVTFLGLLQSQGDFSALLDAISIVPGLAATLNAASGVTILAPTNAAFGALDPASPEAQAIKSENASSVEALINYHVVKGLHPSSSFRAIPAFFHTVLSNQYEFDGAIAAKVTSGQNVGLVLNGKKYQAISGELQISTITLADTRVNGVIVHKIDHVLKMPRLPSITAGDFGFTACTGALEKADLAATIDGARDLTVFVPTNEAFESVGSVLKGASMEKLQAIAEYHVIPGSVMWSPTIADGTVKSLSGDDITFSVVDGSAYVNTAHILVPNIPILNGVAHVIDAVLNPDAGPIDRSDLKPDMDPSPAWTDADSDKAPFTSLAPTPDATLGVPAIATTARGIAVGFSSTPAAGSRPTIAAGEALLGAGAAVFAAFAL